MHSVSRCILRVIKICRAANETPGVVGTLPSGHRIFCSACQHAMTLGSPVQCRGFSLAADQANEEQGFL